MSAERDIRIWQVGPHRSARGGISTVIRELLAAQAGQPGIRLQHLTTMMTGSKLGKIASLIAAWLRLFAGGLLRQVDLLHVHTSSDRSFKRKALLTGLAHRWGIPFILHVHGSNFDKWYEESPLETQSLIKRQLDRAEGIIALSESWREFLAGLTTTPVHVVYNSVKVDAFRWPRPARRPGPLRLLFLGLLGERKGSYDLLDAVQRVVSGDHPISLELRMGGDGDIAQTKAKIAELNLTHCVEYLGWVDEAEKVELLSETDIFVLPSYHEGLPMAILEAMAAGVAILTTPINGIPEAVHEGVNGVFVTPGDVPALAEAIRELALDLGTVRRLGVAGRSEVEKKFNVRVAVEQLSDIYRRHARS